MYCKNCEKEFKKGKFCPKCGEKLIDYDEYEEELEEENEVEDEEVEDEEDDDENEYDETVRQVKEKAKKAAGVAVSLSKALINRAKKVTEELIENSQNGNLQKSIENKIEKFANGGGTKKQETPSEDYDVLKKKLQSLKEMKDEGLLSTEEYEEKRNILLNKRKSENRKQKKEVKREDKINKCPNCGEIVNAFDVKCPSCGFELRGKGKSIKLDEFSDKMDDIDIELSEKNENINRSFDFFGSSAKEKMANAYIAIQKKVEYIRNTPIPNTKEDIIEFMLLASSNININALCENITSSYSMQMGKEEFKNEKLMSEAWYSKMEQAYQKAKILLKDDLSIVQIENLYNTKMKEIKNKKIKSFFFNPMAYMIYILVILQILLFASRFLRL